MPRHTMLRLKHIYISFFITLFIANIFSQSLTAHKCGQLPHEEQTNRSLNWGYGYDDLLSDLSIWAQSPYVVIDSIGATVENRAIWELTISDDPSSDTYKRVYIHARTHPGEEESLANTTLITESNYFMTHFFIKNFLPKKVLPGFEPGSVDSKSTVITITL